MNNIKSGNSVAPDIFDPNVYRLNLSTSIWERFSQNDEQVCFKGVAHYLKDYTLFIGELKSILISPKKFQYMVLPNEEIGIPINTAIEGFSQNSLFVSSNSSSGIKPQKREIKLSTIWLNHKSQATAFIFSSSSSTFSTYILIFGLILLILIVFYVSKKSTKQKQLSLENSENLPHSNVYDSLLNVTTEIVNSDELDQLLGIDHLEVESKKLKRHRILTDLEQQYPGIITRIKDQNDKRRFNYKINKNN